jgi:Domain of unknown function (DUF4157)
MSGSASGKAKQKKNVLAMDSSVRQQLPLVRPSGAHADVLALHQAVGNRAFTAAIRRTTDPPSTSIRRVLKSGGEPLGPSERALMEERFGTDFAHVRIHADTNAASSAEALAAKAYTMGSHIVFGAGQYVPGTDTGNRLLAHELAHVIQQSRSQVVASSDASEREASDAAGAAVAGRSVSVQTAGSGIQCDADEKARRKKPLLIDTAKVDPVWDAYVLQQAAAMKRSPDDPKVRAAANALTAKQVGPTNFARWKEEVRPETIVMDIKVRKVTKEEQEAESAAPTPLPEDLTPQGVRNALIAQADKVVESTRAMQQDVARMESDALKLKTPEGFQGKLYQYSGGAVGATVGPTLGTLSKLTALPVQKVINKVRGKEGGPSLGSIAEEQVSGAVSSYKLTTGALHQKYQETRAPYEAFMSAVREMEDARKTLKNMEPQEDQAAQLAKVRAAKNRLIEAYRLYTTKCEQLGIKGEAKALVAGLEQGAEGVVFALETAATLPLGGPATKQTTKFLRESEKALEKTAAAAVTEGVKDTAKAGKVVVKEAAPAGKEALKGTAATAKTESQEAIEKAIAASKDEVSKLPKTPPANEGGTAPEAIEKAIAASKDDVSKLPKTPPANDVGPASEAVSQAIPQAEPLKLAAGSDIVPGPAVTTENVGTVVDRIVNAAGGMTAKTKEILRVNRIAKQADCYLRVATPGKRDLKAIKAYFAKATPQLGGVAGHEARGMAPKGADIVFLETVGELKMLTIVTRTALDSAFAQAAHYAQTLGKKDVVVRVMDMTNGIIYDFVKKKKGF